MKKNHLWIFLSLVLTFVFAATSFTDAQNSDRLIPSDIVYGYENNQKIAEFNNEVPLP